jgi:hypothetical protein
MNRILNVKNDENILDITPNNIGPLLELDESYLVKKKSS